MIAALALFVALGGTSYAIGGAINGSVLKNGSVAGKKLEKHTVTGTQVKVSTFPKVPSAHLADDATDATTAAKLSGSITGGQVSSAVANATNAATAATATNATNVDGMNLAPITFSGAGPTTVLNAFDGLTLTASCTTGTSASDGLTVKASSSATAPSDWALRPGRWCIKMAPGLLSP